jgi:hypothetical protein
MDQIAYRGHKEHGYLMYRSGRGDRTLSRPVQTLRRKMAVFRLTVFSLQEENGIVRKDGPYQGPCGRKMEVIKQLSSFEGLRKECRLR